MNEKISDHHLQRTASIYIRQSTLQQVRNNLESNRRQYELQDRARELGFQTVVVIDDDLGISGILYQMGKIYAIERKLKAKGFTPLERQQVRWEQTRRHYEHLQKLFQHLQKTRRILPKSKLGKALSYALDQWKHLEPCFHDGQIEFDNNHTEGAIRPTKLGAKNWTFVGGEETGWRSAVIYTVVEQIRRHNLDPHAYLEWVFEKLIHNPAEDELEALLPVNWVAAQRSASTLQSSVA